MIESYPPSYGLVFVDVRVAPIFHTPFLPLLFFETEVFRNEAADLDELGDVGDVVVMGVFGDDEMGVVEEWLCGVGWLCSWLIEMRVNSLGSVE